MCASLILDWETGTFKFISHFWKNCKSAVSLTSPSNFFNSSLWKLYDNAQSTALAIGRCNLAIFDYLLIWILCVNFTCHSVLHVPHVCVLMDDNIKSFIFKTWPQFAIGSSGQCLPDKANYNEDKSITLLNKHQNKIKG